jgi:hypothetical protein
MPLLSSDESRATRGGAKALDAAESSPVLCAGLPAHQGRGRNRQSASRDTMSWAGKSLAAQERRSACVTRTPRVSHCGAPKEFALALIHGTPWSCGARVLVTAILPLAPYTL